MNPSKRRVFEIVLSKNSKRDGETYVKDVIILIKQMPYIRADLPHETCRISDAAAKKHHASLPRSCGGQFLITPVKFGETADGCC